MWYGTKGGVAYATSGDGIQWFESNNSTPLTSIAADANHPLVEYYPSGFPGSNDGENPSGAQMYYRIWYWDSPLIYTISAIRYAESPDGINWYDDQPLQNGSVPIISGGDSWNRGSYGPCDVLYNPSASNIGNNPWDYSFVMYYDGTTGGDESIGLGYSTNGIIWNGYDSDGDGKADPVLEGSGWWDSGYVSRCTVIFKDSLYHMWYSGGTNRMDHGIGYASSSDGINWTKDLNNPIFHKDDGEDWRSERTYCPMVIDDKMWFSGKDASGNYTIGLAIPSAIPATVEIKPEILNLKSKGNFTAFIQLPEGYDVVNIDGNTVVCEGASAVKWNVADDTFIAKFNGSDLVGVLPGDAVKLTVTGQLTDGTPFEGSDTIKVIQKGKPAPALLKFALGQNFRNPFNPDTWIPYTLANDVDVVIRIYNLLGKLVCTLDLGHQRAGAYLTKEIAAYWDGKDSLGQKVASGVYFYTLQAGEFKATRRMVIMK
ncbi:MAG: T9SS type A sorting domain-containing protein [Deltaproteobacteria bacterium]|nr:T9SS type A sorting domain-containing protein [Deltaproteobacteria bacterium]